MVKKTLPAFSQIFSFTFEEFKASEAARITGLSTVLQLDYRRRGYLPTSKGHARFNAIDLAELWTLRVLADRGIGPQRGKIVSRACAEAMVLFALKDKAAWSGWPRGLLKAPTPWLDMDFANSHFSERRSEHLLVWWGEESFVWTNDLSEAFVSARPNGSEAAAIVLDIEFAGVELLQNAAGPLVKVEKAND